ncbi:MAG: YdeI/OmpD-associated family protein [Chloroflexi bacterium]|nr:YdeI/OmpD-associated family protein [Chloroflexota bacterium]
MVEIVKRKSFKNRDAWHAWLAKNYARETELWVVLYKKNSGKASVSYDEAVEEALCFGWIDGIAKGIDGEKYAQRFSPRRKGSIWSESNKKRVAKMIAQGRMTDAGLAKIHEAKQNGEWDKATIREDTTNIPLELKRALAADKQAQQNFDKLAPSHKRQFIYWITEAKREETRARRIAMTIQMVKQNQRLGIDTRMNPKQKTSDA